MGTSCTLLCSWNKGRKLRRPDSLLEIGDKCASFPVNTAPPPFAFVRNIKEGQGNMVDIGLRLLLNWNSCYFCSSDICRAAIKMNEFIELENFKGRGRRPNDINILLICWWMYLSCMLSVIDFDESGKQKILAHSGKTRGPNNFCNSVKRFGIVFLALDRKRCLLGQRFCDISGIF